MFKFIKKLPINLISPPKIILIIWGTILSLYSFKLIIRPEISLNTILSFVLFLFFIFLGFLTSKIMLFKKISIKTDLKQIKIIKKVYLLLTLVSIIGLILIYFKLFSQFSILDFFLKQQIIKRDATRSRIGSYLVLFSYVLIPLSNYLFYYNRINRKKLFLPFIISTLYGISYWGRYPIMVALILFVSSYFIMNSSRKKSKLTLKKILYIVVVFLISFILIYSFLSWTIELRMRTYGPNYGYTTDDINYQIIGKLIGNSNIIFGSLRGFISTYSYLVSPIYTLDFYLNSDFEFLVGRQMFPYFFRLFTSQSYRLPQVGRGLQLPTFIGYSFIDFGFLGIIVYSFLLGFFSYFFYKISLNKRSLTGIMFFPIMLAFLLMTPFISYSSQTLFVVQIFYSICIIIFVRIK